MPECGPKEKPDYRKCEWSKIALRTDNIEAWDIYRRVYGQHTAPGVLNVLAVYETMDRMEIPKDEQLEMIDFIRWIDGKVAEGLKVK